MRWTGANKCADNGNSGRFWARRQLWKHIYTRDKSVSKPKEHIAISACRQLPLQQCAGLHISRILVQFDEGSRVRITIHRIHHKSGLLFEPRTSTHLSINHNHITHKDKTQHTTLTYWTNVSAMRFWTTASRRAPRNPCWKAYSCSTLEKITAKLSAAKMSGRWRNSCRYLL